MIYRCPGCGGALIFDPESNGMTCKYCEQIFPLSELDDSDEKRAASKESKESFQVKIYSCTSCGAELMVNETEVSTFCAYCNQPTVVFSRISNELRPNCCIPFSVSEEEAARRIYDNFSTGWFTPKELKNPAEYKLRGIYVPFWLHDIKIHARSSVTGTTGSGDSQVTHRFYRDVEATYCRITTDASDLLSDELSQRLEPYDLKKIIPFRPKYLSGFYADRYDTSEKETREIAMARATQFMDSEILQSIEKKYENKTFVFRNYQSRQIKHEYALLPAWFMNYTHNNKTHTIVVNGQTGKVAGIVPLDRKKICLLLFTLVPSVTILFGLLNVELFSFFGSEPNELYFYILAGIYMLILGYFGASLNSWRKYRKHRKYFSSTNTVSYVEERQENEWTP